MDAWGNALLGFDGREDLYENGKEALVDGGYRHCAAQMCYSAGDTLPQRVRQRYIFATESRWRMGICNSMVGRAKYHGVQNCTIITPSPPLLLSATLSSLPSPFLLTLAAMTKSLLASTLSPFPERHGVRHLLALTNVMADTSSRKQLCQ